MDLCGVDDYADIMADQEEGTGKDTRGVEMSDGKI